MRGSTGPPFASLWIDDCGRGVGVVDRHDHLCGVLQARAVEGMGRLVWISWVPLERQETDEEGAGSVLCHLKTCSSSVLSYYYFMSIDVDSVCSFMKFLVP